MTVAGPSSMYALNFYSTIVADQLRSRRKTATIRLGDKSRKYQKGMVVQVLGRTQRRSARLAVDGERRGEPARLAAASPPAFGGHDDLRRC